MHTCNEVFQLDCFYTQHCCEMAERVLSWAVSNEAFHFSRLSFWWGHLKKKKWFKLNDCQFDLFIYYTLCDEKKRREINRAHRNEPVGIFNAAKSILGARFIFFFSLMPKSLSLIGRQRSRLPSNTYSNKHQMQKKIVNSTIKCVIQMNSFVNYIDETQWWQKFIAHILFRFDLTFHKSHRHSQLTVANTTRNNLTVSEFFPFDRWCANAFNWGFNTLWRRARAYSRSIRCEVNRMCTTKNTAFEFHF